MEGEVIIPVDLDTKRFDNEIKMVERQLNDLASEYERYSKMKGFDKDKNEMVRIRAEMEKLQNRLVSLNQQKAKWNQEDFRKIDLTNIGNATDNIIRKVLKWGLALFSIRSAYSFIRRSVSELSQTNEQIGADIEYIRWALAQTLLPVVKFIINLVYTLLSIINSISMALFGVNLFASATADNFKKTKNNIKGANTEAKKLQKTLAGFDEMNILQEDGGTASGGGGGGVGNFTPSFDLSNMFDTSILDGLKHWWDDIIKFWEEDWYDFFSSFDGHWDVFMIGLGNTLKGWYEMIKGFGELVAGVFMTIFGLITGNSELVEQGISLLLEGLKDMFIGFLTFITGKMTMGLGIIKGLLGTLDDLLFDGFFGKAFGAVEDFFGGLINWFGELFNSTETYERKVEDLKTANDRLKESQENLRKVTSDYTYAQERAEKASKDLEDAESKLNVSGKDLFNEVIFGQKSFDSLTETEKKLYKAYLENEDAQKQLNQASKDLIQTQGSVIANSSKVSGAIYNNTQAYDENFETIIKGYKETGIITKDAINYMINMMTNMDDAQQRLFIQSLPQDMQIALANTGVFSQAFSNSLKSSINDVGNQANTTFTSTIPNAMTKTQNAISSVSGLFNKLKQNVSNWTGGTIKFAVGGVGNAKGGIVTKLATGGIVNRPGRGVPVASSYMGEAGREGILPLTDSQAMETLGQAIGKYISLNATIPIYMGNRQIAREIQKIQAEDDFAYNGG